MTKVFSFHLMPYLDADIEGYNQNKYDSAWVTYPNKHYDPVKGHQYYNEFLEQLEYADRMGFDAVCVNEHHQNSYGNMPSPNIMAAMLARSTKGKIAILGNATSLHSLPQRVAEEIAMLDVVTGGDRIICGLVRGIGAEYFNFRNVNPNESKDRFYEAHDLILKAWYEDGPIEFHGEYFDVPFLNAWPRPISKQIPIFLPSTGSRDTVKFAARHKYPYIVTVSSLPTIKKIYDDYREQANRFGYTAVQSQLGLNHKIYVAETDAKAWEEFEEHIRFWYKYQINFKGYQAFPPGYIGAEARQFAMEALVNDNIADMSPQEMFDKGYVTVGSPETVKQRLTELQKETGVGVINAFMQIGNMPHWKAMKNIDLFSRYVLKDIQKLGDDTELEQGDTLAGKNKEEVALYY
ncbi:alkanesulfonate monooxygenase SsuD/methylene tetrahydromethanopterin reductase-like flavin-dependent oxidoreductase (luciferase family) [Neobacillus niacini]|uniref:LLM class flavin-dependent oxidoreductase n=1 Tax=Neobacillus niacini TaxID=86668 RepID=UPI0028674A77|nr:LLM class flavin-dependent oxidoreductase [Neobacillus niacini]MDR7075766.1 alkanesulfonate monooxygenase SsuD/methylene tetrahydromethanopterin reductase-like flavin-dependent oxidoreductase (luciferase family) [Neobacillus niacini]